MLYAYADTIAQEHYCKRCGRIREVNGQAGLDVVSESMDYLPECADCFDDIDVPLTGAGIEVYVQLWHLMRKQLADCSEPIARSNLWDRLYAYESILHDHGVSMDSD